MTAIETTESPTYREQQLEALVNSFVLETIDYATINKLGDPEKQHNVRWARDLGCMAGKRPSNAGAHLSNEVHAAPIDTDRQAGELTEEQLASANAPYDKTDDWEERQDALRFPNKPIVLTKPAMFDDHQLTSEYLPESPSSIIGAAFERAEQRVADGDVVGRFWLLLAMATASVIGIVALISWIVVG